MFVTSERAQASVNRGLELGAADYVVKPASAAVVVAKAGRIIADSPLQEDRRTRGVSARFKRWRSPM